MARRQRLKELITPFSGIDQSNQSTLIPDGLSPRAQNTVYDYGEIAQKAGTIALGATVTSGLISYDTQTADFTLGATLTGGTSGATGIIKSDTDTGTEGELRLTGVTGTFQSGETITDDGSSGSATSTTVLENTMPFGGSNAEEVQGIANFHKDDGNTDLICLTTKAIYTYSSSNDSWTPLNVGVDATIVDGTDGKKYVCTFDHTSDATPNRPISGDDEEFFWALTSYTSDTKEAWATAQSYVDGTWTGSSTVTPSFTHAIHAPSIGNTLNAGRYLVINNGINDIQLFDGTSVFPLRTYDIAEAEYVYYQAVQTIFFNSVLIQLGPNDVPKGTSSPHQIWWSAVGDILDWNATSSASNSGIYNLIDTSGPIVRGEIIGDNAIAIYKEDAIYLLSPSGSNTVFNIQLSVNGTGLLSAGAVAVLEDRHIFIAPDGFFIYSGGSTVQPAGRNVWKEFIEDLDFQNKKRIKSIVDRENTRVKFYFPSASGGTGKNTRVVIYDYGEDWWSLEELSGNVSSLGSFQAITSRTWGNPAAAGDGSWGAQTETWGEVKSTQGAILTLFGDSGGYTTQSSNGSFDELSGGVEQVIDQRHETKDLTSADIIGQDYRDRYMLFQGLIIDAKGRSIDVEYSVDEGVTWNTIKLGQSLTGAYQRYKLDFRVTSRIIRFRFRNNIANSYFRMRNRLGIRFIARNR